MTTGTEQDNEGWLKVTADGVVVVNECFHQGDKAIDTCFTDLEVLTVSGPNPDGWAGKIEITDCGKPASPYCEGCNPSSSLKDECIMVNGNDDAPPGACPTQCMNGATCSIVWDKQSCPCKILLVNLNSSNAAY